MTTFRRLRGLLIALGLLALSANLAFAGQPSGASASQAAAHRPAAPESKGDKATNETEETEETESSEASESACPDIDLLTVTDLSAYSHGEIVCSAAHMDTPEGYDNHGAWVSHWAKGDHGSQSKAESHRGKGAADKP